MNMNSVQLIGRMTRDPELKYTPSGTAVAQFTLAINRRTKEKQADFIPVVLWKGTAEFAANYGSKGRLVAVEGRIQTRNYTNSEGRKVYITEVVGHNFMFLDKNNGYDEVPTPPEPEMIGNNDEVDDIPF